MDNILKRIIMVPKGTPREALYIETGLLDPEVIGLKNRVLMKHSMMNGTSQRMKRFTTSNNITTKWAEKNKNTKQELGIDEWHMKGEKNNCEAQSKQQNKRVVQGKNRKREQQQIQSLSPIGGDKKLGAPKEGQLYETRPTLERRKTLGHLRSINRNVVIHFANQSQTCQLLKILTRSLYAASFLVIFFFFFFSQDPCRLHLSWPFSFFFVTFSFSIPVHWILPSHLHFYSVVLLFIFPEFWKWSGAPFPFCIVLLPHFLALWQSVYFSWPCQLNLSVTVNIYQQLPMPLKTRSENQRLQNFYSIIHPYSTCTVSHQDYLIIRYMYIYTRYARFFNACFAYRFLICRPIISFTNFIKSLSLPVIFRLNFRHGLSIDRSHVHLSIYKRSFYQEFQKISKLCSFENSLRKVGHIGLSHVCHVIWRRSLIGCLP